MSQHPFDQEAAMLGLTRSDIELENDEFRIHSRSQEVFDQDAIDGTLSDGSVFEFKGATSIAFADAIDYDVDFVKVDLLMPRRHKSPREIFDQLTREALLRRHTQITLAAASAALDDPWKFGGQYQALRILEAAAPRYERLGGDLHPWEDASCAGS